MDEVSAQHGSRARHSARRPLVIGLIAAGGAGIYAAAQFGGEPAISGSVDREVAPSVNALAGAVPAPQFGPAAPLDAGEPVASPVPLALSTEPLAAMPVKTRASRRSGSARAAALHAAGPRTIRSGRRHYGSFSVPSRGAADSSSLALTPALPAAAMASDEASLAVRPAAPFVPVQAGMVENHAELLAEPVPAATMAQSPAIMPVALGLTASIPAVTETSPSAALAAPNTVLVSPEISLAQPAATLRASKLRPAPRTGAKPHTVVSPAPFAGTTGVEGLAGLDDSRLSAVRPIGGAPRPQQAAGTKRRGGEDVTRPAARVRTAEEAPSNPDEISAAGSGIDLRIPASINDSVSGNLPLRVSIDGAVSVKLGDLLALIGSAMDASQFSSLRQSSATSSYVSIAALRTAGIMLDYQAAGNRVTLSAASA